MKRTRPYGTHPDVPDHRDQKYEAPRHVRRVLPRSVDLRPGCPPVEDQRPLSACSAYAIGAALWFDVGAGDSWRATPGGRGGASAATSPCRGATSWTRTSPGTSGRCGGFSDGAPSQRRSSFSMRSRRNSSPGRATGRALRGLRTPARVSRRDLARHPRVRLLVGREPVDASRDERRASEPIQGPLQDRRIPQRVLSGAPRGYSSHSVSPRYAAPDLPASSRHSSTRSAGLPASTGPRLGLLDGAAGGLTGGQRDTMNG